MSTTVRKRFSRTLWLLLFLPDLIKSELNKTLFPQTLLPSKIRKYSPWCFHSIYFCLIMILDNFVEKNASNEITKADEHEANKQVYSHQFYIWSLSFTQNNIVKCSHYYFCFIFSPVCANYTVFPFLTEYTFFFY